MLQRRAGISVSAPDGRCLSPAERLHRVEYTQSEPGATDGPPIQVAYYFRWGNARSDLGGLARPTVQFAHYSPLEDTRSESSRTEGPATQFAWYFRFAVGWKWMRSDPY